MFDERELKAQMVRRGVGQKELADALGIDPSTLYRKIKADGNFTRAEINTIVEFLRIDDPRAIFFADELAETQE